MSFWHRLDESVLHVNKHILKWEQIYLFCHRANDNWRNYCLERVEKNFIPVFALHFLMSWEALLLQDSYRKVVVHYVKTNVLGKKGPFSAKAGRWFWLFIFFPPSKKSKKTADTYRSGKYDLWWHHVLPKQICFKEDCFFMICCNKEILNHSWRSIGSDSSPFCCFYPTPTFPFLLCQS